MSAVRQYGILISHPGFTASGAPGHSRNTNIGRTGSGRMEGSDKQSRELRAEETDRSCRGCGDVRTDQQQQQSRSLASNEVDAESVRCAGGTRDTGWCHLTKQ